MTYCSILSKLVLLTHFWLCFQAGTGIAELIALEMSKQVNKPFFVYKSITLISLVHFKFQLALFFYLFLLFLLQTKTPIEETRKKIWLVDSKVVQTMISFHEKY